MKAPITQTLEWKQLQDDLCEVSFFEQGSGYQYLAILKKTPTGNYLYLPYGPVFEQKSGLENSLKSLKNLATRQNAFFVRVEPQSKLFTDHLPSIARKSTDLNPKETWQLDLTEEDLKSRLPSRLLRYYKNAEKNGLTIETSHNPDDIHYLLDLQKVLAKEKNINTFSENYLKTELSQPFATLYLVKRDEYPRLRSTFADVANTERPSPVTTGARERSENDGYSSAGQEVEDDSSRGSRSAAARGLAPVTHGDGLTGRDPRGAVSASNCASEVIAAGLVFDDRTTRYNLQGAQSEQGRKLHATGILTIKLILDAAEKGQKTFDFWGIAPENAPKDHPWQGFTNFKKTFAGFEVDYSGTYDLVLNPSKYRLYSLLRKFNRLIRK